MSSSYETSADFDHVTVTPACAIRELLRHDCVVSAHLSAGDGLAPNVVARGIDGEVHAFKVTKGRVSCRQVLRWLGY